MNAYQGKCLYCGNEQPIMAESQEIANKEVSNTCSCNGASFHQKKGKLMERINYIAKGEYNPIFPPLTEDQTEMLRDGGVNVMLTNCNAITFEFNDSKNKIWFDGEKYKVTRTGTRKAVEEI